jgi:hypothetical protein
MSDRPIRGYIPQLAEIVSGLSVHELRRKTVLGHMVIGPQRRIQPVHYRIMQNAPDEIGCWVRATGNPRTPPLPWPAIFRNITELRLHPEAFSPFDDVEHRDDFPGVGYQIDEQTVMGAVLSTERVQDFLRHTPSVYMRVY